MQKKYPFIKIDIQNITKQEKKNKKIKQIENMMIKPFNIWFFDKEAEEKVSKSLISRSKFFI